MGEMEVIEAEDGAAALALIAERQPLLVLLDVNLPDVDGLEVCRRIKADWPDIVVIQISATAIIHGRQGHRPGERRRLLSDDAGRADGTDRRHPRDAAVAACGSCRRRSQANAIA